MVHAMTHTDTDPQIIDGPREPDYTGTRKPMPVPKDDDDVIVPEGHASTGKLTTSVRLDRSLLARLDEIAVQRGFSRNMVIDYFLHYALKKYEEKQGQPPEEGK
jgi:hypothetical protein